MFRVDLRPGVKLRQFRNSFCSADRSKKFFADRIRILAFFKFNSTIFRKKRLPVSLFPVPGVVSFKMLLFERVGALPKHADTDDAKAMELLTRRGAI